jgi:hypothetical protein
MKPVSPVFELRQYRLRSGMREQMIELFERALIEPQEAAGIDVVGLFRDPERPDAFLWIRSFANMRNRREALSAFYDGPQWRRHKDAANATMIDSDNVLLLRGELASSTGRLRGPLFCAVYSQTSFERMAAFGAKFDSEIVPQFERRGMTIVARWTTESSENDFPRLPVREGEFVLAALVAGADRAMLADTKPDELFELVPTSRSRIQIGFAES